jgi:DegV family protein with EDD domain
MLGTCILLDSTSQLTRPEFAGRENVHFIPFQHDPGSTTSGTGFASFPPRLIPPGLRDFQSRFEQLSRDYSNILFLAATPALNPVFEIAQKAAVQFVGRASVQVINSQTVGLGVGILAELAARMAATDTDPAEIEKQVRISALSMYTMLCLPGLKYLSQMGQLSRPQALIGEMLGLMPLYVLDEDNLLVLNKIRTQRHLFENIQEFVEEFTRPSHIAYLRPAGALFRLRALRQYAKEKFPMVPFSEQELNSDLAALLGPQSAILAVLEYPEKSS